MADENLGSSYLQQNRQSEARRAGDALLSELGLDPMGQPMQAQQPAQAQAPGLGPVRFENISPQDRAMIEQRLGIQPGAAAPPAQPMQPGQPQPVSAAEHAAGAAGRIRKIRAEQAKEQQPSFIRDVIGGTAVELPRATISGIRNAVKIGLQSAEDLATFFSEKTGIQKGNILPGKGLSDVITGDKPGLFGKASAAVPQIVEDPTTPGGKVLSGIAQFATGYLTGSKLLGGAGMAPGATKAALSGAFSDLVAFDPADPVISNLINDYFPNTLKNPLTEFLATDPEDSKALNRFKRVVDGLIPGVAADVVMNLAKGWRANRAIKQVEGAFEQAKAAEQPAAAATSPFDTGLGTIHAPDLTNVPPNLGVGRREYVRPQAQTADTMLAEAAGVMQAERKMLPVPGQSIKTADELAENLMRERKARMQLEGSPTLRAAQESQTIKNEVIGNPTLRAAYETTLRGESEEAIADALVKKAKPELEAVAREVFTSAKEPEAVSRATVAELERGLREEAPVGIPPRPEKFAGEKLLTPHEQEIAAAQRLARGEQPAEANFAAFLEKAKTRFDREEAGRAILDDLEESGRSPKQVIEDFWDKTFNRLPDSVKIKFENYIKRETGMEPGSTLAVESKTGKAIKAKSFQEIFSADQAPELVEHLEGTERGLVALMEAANRRYPPQQTARIGEAGEISPEMLYTLARAAVGGALGLSQGDTMEERIANGVMTAAGLAIAPRALKKLIGAFERVAPREAKVIKSFDPPTLDVTKRGVTRRPPKEIGPVQVASKEQADEFLKANPDAIEIGDKAIKIQWDEVNSQAEFDRVTKTLVSLHEAEIDVARRGKISDQASKQLADMLGITEEDMLRRRRGQALNAEQSRAFVSLYASSAKKLDDLATRMKAGENVENQFRLHLGRTTALLEQVYGARAEWGRAGRAWQGQGQILREGQSLSQQIDMLSLGGKNIQDVPAERLAEMILALNSPAQKATFLSHATKMGQSAVLEAWMNGLLSNPVTHVANAASNATTTFMGIAERAIAGQFGKEVARGEATAMMHGVLGGWREAMDIARRTFAASESALGFSKMENVQRAITADNFGATGQMGRAVDMLGSVVSTPGRALMAADDFFKAINYRAELNAQAWRQASKEGLSGNALKKRAADLATDVDFASLVKDQAEGYAFYQTFNQELGRLGEGYIDFLGKHPWARIVTPFVRTPINIAKYTLERTPLVNLAMNQVRADIAAGGIKRELALAKMGMGGLIFGSAAGLAMGGYITGGGPKDPTLRAMKRATGWQPYSVKVGDSYVSFSRLDPIGFVFGIGADFVEKAGELDDMNLGNLGAAAVVAMQDTFLDKTYMQGLMNAFKLVEGGTWSGKAEQFTERLAGSVVPAGLAQFTKQLDPTLKEVNGAADAIFARLPGFSQDIPPRRNLWGEPIMLEGGVGPDLVSPFYTSTQKDDPVTDELLRLELPIKMPSNYIFGSRPTDNPFANEDPRRGVRLLPEEYDRYVVLAGNELKLGGKGLHDKLAEVIESAAYQGQSELAKKTLIQRYVNIYRDAAEAELMSDREFPELKEEIRTKLEERREALRPGQ
jgi:hypothetical protein